MFTDHKNILFMLSPTRFNANVARHVVHKVQRWALRLSEFNFIIEHIPGEQNVWADILTRWAAPNNTSFPSRRVGALRVPLITSEAVTPELPSLIVIEKSQKVSPPTPEAIRKYGYKLSEDSPNLWEDKHGKLYVPPEDEELLLRICVSAHCGLGGHRGYTATCTTIKQKLHWPTIEADVKTFVQSCLVCLLSASGDKVPRPLGHQVHAERINEILHFDYLYIGESAIGHEYILILKDDFSGYVFLRSCASACAEATADVLAEYFTTFVPVLNWFSDQGSHFKNEVMELLASSLGAKHRFSTAYVPWSNGTVEAVCKEVLRVMHALSAELRIPEAEWTKTVPAIQSIINNSPSRRLGNRAPITVHTGMEPGNPLLIALQTMNVRDVSSVGEAEVIQKLEVDSMLKALDEMHKEVASTLEGARGKAVDCHNRKTHVRPYNPSVGDYVVVARTKGPKTKMSANWVGPRRVARILSDFTVELEHLLTQETSIVHISRIKHYADSLVGTKVQMEDIAEFNDRVWYAVDKIKDLRFENDKFEVLVAWRGFTAASDSWEPLTMIFEDVPSKVRDFIKRRRSSVTLRKAKASLGL